MAVKFVYENVLFVLTHAATLTTHFYDVCFGDINAKDENEPSKTS